MSIVKIIIPVYKMDLAKDYYSRVMGFGSSNGLFFFPGASEIVALKLMHVDQEAERLFPPRRAFPLFNYEIAGGFLDYCNERKNRGANIRELIETPGGYYALFMDLDGNQFEVECQSFD